MRLPPNVPVIRLVLALVALAAPALAAPPPTAVPAADGFVPLSYDLVSEFRYDAPPSDVCRYFEPEARAIYDSFWKPEVVRPAAGPTKEGLVLRVPTPFGDGRAILVFVNAHDPEAMTIRYSILYQEVEVEKFDVRCVPTPEGGTHAVVRTLIVGLNEYGNRAVRSYVEGGQFAAVVLEQRAAIRERLRAMADGRGGGPA